jgi:hypothetical protein
MKSLSSDVPCWKVAEIELTSQRVCDMGCSAKADSRRLVVACGETDERRKRGKMSAPLTNGRIRLQLKPKTIRTFVLG